VSVEFNFRVQLGILGFNLGLISRIEPRVQCFLSIRAPGLGFYSMF
jgi:hypothetical protein